MGNLVVEGNLAALDFVESLVVKLQVEVVEILAVELCLAGSVETVLLLS